VHTRCSYLLADRGRIMQ